MDNEETVGSAAASAPDVPTEAEAETVGSEPVELAHAPVEVGLQRSVRYGRIIIATVVLGLVIGIIASLLFPVEEGADYELGQVTGLMAVVGGAIGLAVGAILSLLLGRVAKRKRGAAIAVQTDVK